MTLLRRGKRCFQLLIPGTGIAHAGTVDPPCNADNTDWESYNVVLPASHFLSIDGLGETFPVAMPAGGGHFSISLTDYQGAILDALAVM